MDVQYVKPFIESVFELFKTMLACTPRKLDVKKSDQRLAGYQIAALIGLTGPMRGTVALILPRDTASNVVSRFIGVEELEEEAIIDGVSELVNIVAGSAKAKLATNGAPAALSLPNVITGTDSNVLAPSWATWVEIGFDCDLGPFSLRIAMEQKEEAK